MLGAEEFDAYIKTMATFPIQTTPYIAGQFVEILNTTIPLMGAEKFWGMSIRLRFHFDKQEAKRLIEIVQKFPPSPQTDYLCLCLNGIIGYHLLMGEGEGFLEYFKRTVEIESKTQLNPKFSLKSYACIRKTSQAHQFGSYFQEQEAVVVYAGKDRVKEMGYGYVDVCRAEYAFFQRDLRGCIRHASIAIVKASEVKEFYMEDLAYFYLMRIYVAQGKYEQIQEVIQSLRKHLDIYEYPDYYTMYTVASDWFHVLMGHPEKSSIWNSRNVLGVESMTTTHAFGWFQLLIARCYWADERYDELYPYLCSLDSQSVSRDFVMGELEVTAFKAVVLFRLNLKQEAMETLKKAYELAVVNDFIMPFAELGNSIVSLVKYTIKQSKIAEVGIPEAWLLDIQKKASAYAKKVSFLSNIYHQAMGLESVSTQRLTQKELDCLQDLCRGLSRAQIAADRDLSENYVKLLLQNIYTKLGVKNSKEAIRVATAQNLI